MEPVTYVSLDARRKVLTVAQSLKRAQGPIPVITNYNADSFYAIVKCPCSSHV